MPRSEDVHVDKRRRRMLRRRLTDAKHPEPERSGSGGRQSSPYARNFLRSGDRQGGEWYRGCDAHDQIDELIDLCLGRDIDFRSVASIRTVRLTVSSVPLSWTLILKSVGLTFNSRRVPHAAGSIPREKAALTAMQPAPVAGCDAPGLLALVNAAQGTAGPTHTSPAATALPAARAPRATRMSLKMPPEPRLR